MLKLVDLLGYGDQLPANFPAASSDVSALAWLHRPRVLSSTDRFQPWTATCAKPEV